MIPDAATQQQEEQQGLAQCYAEWINDKQAQREYKDWLLRTYHADWIADYERHEFAAPQPRTLTSQEPDMKYPTPAGSYLKKDDVPEPQLLTIGRFKVEDVAKEGEPKEEKLVVYFDEHDKGMVLNSTNSQILQKAFGPDTDDAVGQKIVLEVDENVSFGGKLVGGLRLRLPRAAPKAPNLRPPKGADPDESIPF